MHLDLNSGRLTEAEWLASPNCDQRPAAAFVNTLVIHAISLPPAQFGGQFVEAFFCNQLDPNGDDYFKTIKDIRVSAHFYIRRDGSLKQFVATHMRAWHAGVSTFKGMSRVNDFSIGIELEGDDETPFTDAQYECLNALKRCLMASYPAITQERIVGHSDIAPGRKTDPGPYFDWPRLMSLPPESLG